jgi:transketolase
MFDVLYSRQTGHWGGSSSAVELVTALYFSRLNIRPKEPRWEDRDRFILSKGHAAINLYTVLAHRGFFPEEELPGFRTLGSMLQGHPSMKLTPGVDLSTGALGHGVSAGVGMALAASLQKKNFDSGEAIKIRTGYGVTIAANGITAAMSLEAAEILARFGIDAEVLSVPFVKPLRLKVLGASVKRTGNLVTVEEHNVFGGFGSACLEGLVKAGISFKYDAVGLEDRFGETGPYGELLAACGLSAGAIAKRVRKLLK